MGRPAEPHLLRSCSLWVSLYLVGGSLTSWAGNPFEPQFPVFLAATAFRGSHAELDKIVVEQTEKWSSRTCSLAPDKLSNAPIYDLCGQLNHPGQRCSLGDLFDQRHCQCEQWVSLAFLEGNLVDPSLIVRESVADLADSVFEPVDRISQLQFLSHCYSPSLCRSDALKRAATITRQGYYGE